MSEYKLCPNCGLKLDKNADFCPNCDMLPEQHHGQKETEKITVNGSQESEKMEIPKQKIPQEVIQNEQKEKPIEAEKLAKEVIKEETSSKENETLNSPTSEGIVSQEEPKATNENQVIEPETKHESVAVAKTVEEEPQESSEKTAVTIEKFKVNSDKKEPRVPNESSEVPQKLEKPIKKKGTKKYLFIAAVVLLAVGGGFGFQKYQAKVSRDQQIALGKQVTSLEKEYDGLYLNDQKVFLKADIKPEELAKLDEELAKIKDKPEAKQLLGESQEIQKKLTELAKINDYFTTPVIEGDKFQEQAVLKDQKTASALKPLTSESNDLFTGLINQGIEEAKAQEANLTEAKNKMATVYGQEVLSGVTREQYKVAQEVVGKVKNPTLKTTYEENLKKVDSFLVAQEKEVAAKKAAEEAAKKAEAERVAQAQKEAAEKQQAADNVAWQWNEGIKDKVIQECIRRGYIVEGGYELRKKEVINGEGYYDLYGTSTASKLLKDRKQSELPVYLVTINVKTGWFKGNGPN